MGGGSGGDSRAWSSGTNAAGSRQAVCVSLAGTGTNEWGGGATAEESWRTERESERERGEGDGGERGGVEGGAFRLIASGGYLTHSAGFSPALEGPGIHPVYHCTPDQV